MGNLDKASKLIGEENKYYARSARINYYNLVIDHAHGATLVDVDGNKYIDLLASASAINVGHTHEKVVKAITDQAQKLIHYTPAHFHHVPGMELSEKLAKIAPGTLLKWSVSVTPVQTQTMQSSSLRERTPAVSTLSLTWDLITVQRMVRKPYREVVLT